MLAVMTNAYLPLKQLHIALVVLSVSGFMLRGLGVLAGATWPMQVGVRRGVVLVDSLLLIAGLALWAQLGWAGMAWLQVKLLLLCAYVVLGSLALRGPFGSVPKALCFGLALGCVAQMIGIARHHHVHGWLT